MSGAAWAIELVDGTSEFVCDGCQVDAEDFHAREGDYVKSYRVSVGSWCAHCGSELDGPDVPERVEIPGQEALAL